MPAQVTEIKLRSSGYLTLATFAGK